VRGESYKLFKRNSASASRDRQAIRRWAIGFVGHRYAGHPCRLGRVSCDHKVPCPNGRTEAQWPPYSRYRFSRRDSAVARSRDFFTLKRQIKSSYVRRANFVGMKFETGWASRHCIYLSSRLDSPEVSLLSWGIFLRVNDVTHQNGIESYELRSECVM